MITENTAAIQCTRVFPLVYLSQSVHDGTFNSREQGGIVIIPTWNFPSQAAERLLQVLNQIVDILQAN
jgi:hypothetical protein